LGEKNKVRKKKANSDPSGGIVGQRNSPGRGDVRTANQLSNAADRTKNRTQKKVKEWQVLLAGLGSSTAKSRKTRHPLGIQKKFLANIGSEKKFGALLERRGRDSQPGYAAFSYFPWEIIGGRP